MNDFSSLIMMNKPWRNFSHCVLSDVNSFSFFQKDNQYIHIENKKNDIAQNPPLHKNSSTILFVFICRISRQQTIREERKVVILNVEVCYKMMMLICSFYCCSIYCPSDLFFLKLICDCSIFGPNRTEQNLKGRNIVVVELIMPWFARIS